MWPPINYDDITLKIIFESWKEHILVRKLLEEIYREDIYEIIDLNK